MRNRRSSVVSVVWKVKVNVVVAACLMVAVANLVISVAVVEDRKIVVVVNIAVVVFQLAVVTVAVVDRWVIVFSARCGNAPMLSSFSNIAR